MALAAKLRHPSVAFGAIYLTSFRAVYLKPVGSFMALWIALLGMATLTTVRSFLAIVALKAPAHKRGVIALWIFLMNQPIVTMGAFKF